MPHLTLINGIMAHPATDILGATIITALGGFSAIQYLNYLEMAVPMIYSSGCRPSPD